MLKLKLHVFDESGDRHTITDYLMEKVAYKLRHASETCGLMRHYENGLLEAEMFEGKTGRVKVAIRKDKTGQYPDQNSIVDYLIAETSKPATKSVASRPREMSDLDDEIPF